MRWLVTAALDGDSAVAPQWVIRPDVAVRAVGEGLRTLHESLPVAEFLLPEHAARHPRTLDRACQPVPDGHRRPLGRPRRAYGIAPDRERLASYRDLWNAT